MTTLRVGFGCEQLGGHAWGDVVPADVEAAVAQGIEAGVRLFDTADCYGRGESERRLGRLLRAHRSQVLVATKFGVRLADDGQVTCDSSPEWAEAALHGSLQRLRMDYVDLFQVHRWDRRTPLPDLFERLDRLRASGKCRFIGVTNIPTSELPDKLPTHFVSLSLEFSLVARELEAEAVAAANRGISFISYGTLGQGLLSGRYPAGHRYAADDRRARPSYVHHHGERRVRNAAILETLAQAAAAVGASPARVAVAWALARIPRSIALVGIKRPAQLKDVLGALTLTLPAEWHERLDAVSLQAHAERAHAE